MPYQVVIPKTVQKQLDRLPHDVRLKIGEELVLLAENPRPFGYIKLRGYQDQYRIRVGDYRIQYRIRDEELVVLIVSLRHRKDAYRR